MDNISTIKPAVKKTTAEKHVQVPEENSSDLEVCNKKNQQEEKNVKLSVFQKIALYFSEFTSNSSIHGLRYLGGNETSIIEKCLWLLAVSASLYLCADQIASMYTKWQENPVFIGFNQNPVHLWEIPLPAITVCPWYQFNKNSSYLFEATYFEYDNGTDTEIINRKNINSSLFCDEKYEMPNFHGRKFTEFKINTAISKEQIFNFLYLTSDENIVNDFSPVFTDFRLCFSFNMLDRKDLFHNVTYLPEGFVTHKSLMGWDLDGRKLKINKTHRYPHPATHTMYVSLKSLDKIGCKGFNRYSFLLHHPTEIPAFKETQVETPMILENNRSYTFVIKPTVITSSDALKSYSPRRRGCFFTYESELHFFKTYSFANCRIECLANYTLEKCGCVAHYMPSNFTTEICNDYNRCLWNAEESFDQSEQELSEDPYFGSCNCLPSCTSVIYNTELEHHDDVKDEIFFDVKFKKYKIFSLERQESFGDISFLANCGGLLGLFAGFSVLSFIEILYYLCFRWMHNLVRRYMSN